MWISLVIGVLACLALLYFPGSLYLAVLRMPVLYCLVGAPVVSCLAYCLVSAFLNVLGVGCSWLSVAMPVAVAGLAICVVFLLWQKLRGKSFRPFPLPAANGRDVLWVAAGVAFANLVVLWVFITSLDGPYSLFQQNDLIAHLVGVRDALESGVYFSLDVGIYPQAWYVITALVADLAGVKIAVAINAVNYVLIAFVFSSAMCLFLRVVFSRNRRLANVAVFVPMLFGTFPWSMLTFGPLYPNLSGFCCLPIAMVFFAVSFWRGLSWGQRLIGILLFLLSAICLVLLHPNAVFAGIVLMSPYAVHLIWRHGEHVAKGNPSFSLIKRLIPCIAFIAMVLGIWTALFFAPYFSSLVSVNWASYDSVPNAVKSVLLLRYTDLSAPQIALALLVMAGGTYCLVRKRHVWAVIGYLISAVMLAIGISTEGFLKHFLIGFWYTDTHRVACLASMAAMPLAALGLYAVYQGITRVAGKLIGNGKAIERVACAAVVVALACIISPFYIDNHGNVCKSGLEKAREFLHGGNNLATNVNPFDKEEYEFVELVKEIVPAGETIVNIPYDGSAFAIDLNGIECLYTGWYGYDSQDPSSDSAVIREHLNDIQSDQRVRTAVARLNVAYVMVLDYGNTSDEGVYAEQYERDLWSGIAGIEDDTPGFEIVLKEGDMRLYRISLSD